MNWRFWQKDKSKDKEETIIKIVKGQPACRTEIYVSAQSVDKAFNLYRKVKKESKK